MVRPLAAALVMVTGCGVHEADCEGVSVSPAFRWAMAGYADCSTRCPAGPVPTFDRTVYACACGLSGGDDLTACASDADCFVAEASGCPCTSGGSSVPIGQRGAPRWSAQIQNARERCTEQLWCPAMVSCVWGMPLACVNGRCALRPR